MSLSWFKQTNRISGSGVEFFDSYVEKYFSHDIELEFEKANKIYILSNGTHLTIPKPLECDYKKNIIRYQYITGTVSIKNSYMKFMTSPLNETNGIGDFYSAGEVLGLIHNRLKLTNFAKWEPDMIFAKSMCHFGDGYLDQLDQSTQVFIHGDYSFGNIHTVNNSNNITIYDPCSNGFVTKSSGLLAPIYIDLGNFICNLNGLLPLRSYIGINWKKLELIKDSFISGYEDSTGQTINRNLLDVVTYATAKSYFSYTYTNKVLRWFAMQVLFNSYKRNKVGVRSL